MEELRAKDESLEKRIASLEEQTVASGSNVMAELADLKKLAEKLEKSVAGERDYTNDKVAEFTADLNKRSGDITEKMNALNEKVYEDMNTKTAALTEQLNVESEELTEKMN